MVLDPGNSVLAKERQCIELASRIILGNRGRDTLSWHLYEALIAPLTDPLGLILLPLIILLAPYSVYEAMRSYQEAKTEREEIAHWSKNHKTPLRDLHTLWSRYGSRVHDYCARESVTAECFAEWTRVLYGNTYYLPPAEILRLFDEEFKKQGNVINEACANGIDVNLDDWQSVVVQRLIQEAPPY